MAKKKRILFDLLLLLVLGLLSLTWFRGNHLINGGDFGMPFDWVKCFKSMFSVWAEGYSLGAPDPRNIASLFPYATFGALFQSLGFSLVFIEKFFFYLWFVGGGLSMYFLGWVLGMKRLGRLMAAFFYMLNPFSLIVVWHISHALLQMPYSFAPLYLGLYIYGLREKKGLPYIFVFVLAWICTTVPAYAWPAALAIHLTPLFFYFVFSLIYFPKERAFILRFTLKLALVFLGLNFYWLFPFIYSLSESLTAAHSPVLMNDIETLKLTSNKIPEAIRLLGYWALHSGYKGEAYYSYELYFRSFLVNAVSWLIPFLVALGFLNPESRKKPLPPFFIVSLIFGLTGIAGPNFPLGGLLMTLYKVSPFLALLTRFTFLFYGIPVVIIMAILLGLGFDLLWQWGKKFLGKLLALGPLLILAFLLLVVLVKPFWTGEVIKGEGKITPGERVAVPDYFWQTKKWFSQQKGFYRIFPLPMSQTYNMVYDWGEGYIGGDPIRYISGNPVIFVNTGESFKIPDLIGSLIEEETDFKEAGKLLGLINVKYVLNRKDIKWDYMAGHHGWYAHSPEKIEKFLKNQKDLKLVKSFGPWDIYEVAQEDILPRVYIPEKRILAIGETNILKYFTTEFNPKERNAFFFANGKISKDEINKISPSQVFIEKKPEPANIGYDSDLKDLSLKEINDSLALVRYYPGSPLYNLIRIKETLQKFFAPYPQKIHYDLLFMEKRLKEYYFLINNDSVEKASKTLAEISAGWQKVENDSHGEMSAGQKGELLLMIDKELSLQKMFIKALSKEMPEKLENESIKDAITNLSESIYETRNYFFSIRPINLSNPNYEQEVKYGLNIPVSAEYNLYLPIDAFKDWSIKDGQDIKFKIDDREIIHQSLKTDEHYNELFWLGRFSLDSGKHFIKFFLPPSDNLIANPSFENGLWEGIPEYIQYSYFRERPYKEQVQDAVKGKYSLKLFSSLNNVAVFNRIIDFNPKYIYLVYVYTKNLNGRPPQIVLWEDEKENALPILDPFVKGFNDPFGISSRPTTAREIELPSSNKWQRYMVNFTPKNLLAKSAGLAFISGRTLAGETENLYDDVRVERIFDSPILLKTASLSLGSKESSIKESSTEVDYKKINPTNYEIHVEGQKKPYFLVFSDSFHQDWNLSVKAEHFMVNGYANAWFIDKDDQNLQIKYSHQEIYWVSLVVSLIIGGGLLVLVKFS